MPGVKLQQVGHGSCCLSMAGAACALPQELTNSLHCDDRKDMAIYKAPLVFIVLDAVVVLPAAILVACWHNHTQGESSLM